MIVKNEEKNIVRCLDSVIDLIDTFCICDTGSTDNTVKIIMDYFQNKPNIKGELCFKKFISFDVNRNFCLEQSKDLGDYILFLDADMVLEHSSNKDDLILDYYYVFQESRDNIFKNIRIIKNNINFKYYGVTHEFLQTTNQNLKGEIIPKEKMKIIDLEDGGSKLNKLERDKYLLINDYEKTIFKSRYLFYLGNTFYSMGDYLIALKYYSERLKMRGWDQEMWFSHYRSGIIYYITKNYPKFVKNMIDAYSCDQERVENLYYLIQYYQKIKRHKLAKIYKKIVLKTLDKYNTFDKLFMEKKFYDKNLYS